MADISGGTLEEETANLRAIATELSDKPELLTWAQHNSDIADHVGAIHKLYPWLTPGVSLALGTARYNADDPFVKSIADLTMALGRAAMPKEIGGSDPLSHQSVQRSVETNLLGTDIGGVTPDPGQSIFGRAAGDVGSGIHRAFTAVGGVVPDAMRTQLKTDTRNTFAALSAPLEGIEALGRTSLASMQFNKPIWGNRNTGILGRLEGSQVRGDTTAPILPQLTAVQMINGRNAGSGFFPGGAAHTAAVQAQTNAASIGGHALTVGRGIAGAVLPANTRAYGLVSGLADAGVSLYGDPSQYALGEAGKLRDASSLIGGGRQVAAAATDWGRFDRLRQTIGIRTATEQLNSAAGQGIIAKIAGLHDFRSVDRLLGSKLDPQISAELTRATSTDAVREILDRELGTGIERLPAFHPTLQGLTAGAQDAFGNPIDQGLGNLGYALDRTTRDWRPLALLPGGSIPTDLSQSWTRREAVTQMEAMLVNAKVPGDQIGPILEDVATATNRNQIYDAFNVATKMMADGLTREYGVPAAKARELTRAFSTGSDVEDARQYFRTSLTDKYVVPGVMVNGEPTFFDGPHLPTEHLNSSIPMPNVRDIRRAASKYRQVVNALPAGAAALGAQDLGTKALDVFMHTWKAATLLRPALAVRILGESQLATAAAGDVSAFRHPLDWIAYVTGKKGAASILDEAFDPSDYNEVWKGGAHAISGFDPDRVYAAQWTHFIRGDPGFTDAWAQEVRHSFLDPLSRTTADYMRQGDIDGLKQAFFDGDLRQTRLNLMEPGTGTWRSHLDQRAVSDAYIDTVVNRVRNLTRDDPEVLDAIADGSFRGERLASVKDGKQAIPSVAKYDRAPQVLRDRLGEMDAVEGHAPQLVKGHLYGKTKIGPGAEMLNLRDKTVDRMFNMLVGERMQSLAASPVFRQEYYKEITKLLPSMDPDEAAAAVAAAERAGIGGLDASKAAGSLDRESADMIAKSRSLDTMSGLLHDLGHRSQASDMLRFVAPFGDAWKKVLNRWVNIVSHNPSTIERFRQGYTEATSSGFAHPDPQTGKLVYTIPFSTQIDQAIAGLPFPQTAPLNGLNILGEGLPGVGPALSIPLSLLAPHVPGGTQLMQTLAPYGAPNTKQGLVEAFFPGWLNRVRTAGLVPLVGASPDEQSVFNHSVDEVMRYLVSQGADVSTPEGIAKTVAEARHKATLLYAVRGAMQFTSPSPPSVETMVKDKSGRLVAMYQLTNELQNLYNGKGVDGKGTNDPSQAAQIFLKLHGKSNYLSLQAMSTPRRYGLPTTEAAATWLAAHPDFKDKYPNIYGLLAPQTGKFDYSLYLDQLHTGERQDRTPKEFLELANARIAAMVYDTQRDALPDDASSADKQQYLGQLRTWLKAKYPGYQAQELNVDKAAVPDAIDELSKAVTDPAVRTTEAAQATGQYLQLRQQVIDFERSSGSSVSTNRLSNAAQFAPQSEWLAQQASKLISQYPTWFPVWDMLLSHEVSTFTPPNDQGI